jgi:hypothetical protein
MTAVPDRSTFDGAYAGQAPWDIGRPQRAMLSSTNADAGHRPPT